MMKKRTLITLYSLVLLIFGLLIFLLGSSFEGIKTFSKLSGSSEFTFVIKVIGVGTGAPGIGGLIWALTLSEDPSLPGYAGLNGLGIVIFTVFFILAGPFWLLVAWVLWLIPAFTAHSSALGN